MVAQTLELGGMQALVEVVLVEKQHSTTSTSVATVIALHGASCTTIISSGGSN
jgi:hypothetical protein